MAKPASRVASSIPSSAADCPYRLVLEVSTVTDCTGPPARARAALLGRKPRRAIASRTDSRVDVFTLALSFMTRETVW